MGSLTGPNPRLNTLKIEPQSPDHVLRSNQLFQSTSALGILRETVRILRYNSTGFFAIGAFLICPVSAVVLSNVLVDQSLVNTLAVRLMLVANSSGLPLRPFVKQSCQKLSEMSISAAVCFPLYITLLLISKAAVVYSVDCAYSRKKFDPSKFYMIVRKIWKRIITTYLLVSLVIVGCVASFIVLLVGVSSLYSALGLSPDSIAGSAVVLGLFFSVFLANAIVVCDLSMVISVLEDVSGPRALLRSSLLVRGQTQVGLMIFLGSTIGMALIKGLFENRVRSLSYGDGSSSRTWEAPLLVVVYSFVVLVDIMMSTVFYFSCKSYSLERSNVEYRPVLDTSSSIL